MKKKDDCNSVMALLFFTAALLIAGNALAVTVSSTNPVDGATDVSIYDAITVTFSADMNASTLTTDTFVITRMIDGCIPDISSGTDCLTYIAGSVTVSGATASFKPAANLEPNIKYNAMLRACFGNDPADPFKPTLCIKDTNGNNLDMGLENIYKWSFTTGAALNCAKGDINCDTLVNMADAITGLQICAGMNPLSSKTADVNADSKIGLEDILYVLRFIAGLITP